MGNSVKTGNCPATVKGTKAGKSHSAEDPGKAGD